MIPETPGSTEQLDAGDRRGRRKTAMIAAARALFLERGFEAVSLAEIVRTSGGSLSTLYDLFENKGGLLHAVVRNEHYEKLDLIRTIAATEHSPEETLRMIACALYDQFLRPEKVALLKTVMAESLRNPEFARGIYEEVHLPFVEAIEALFMRWSEAGRLSVPDPRRAALFFIGMVLHPAQTRALCGDPSAICPERRDSAADEIASVFLRGYAAETGK